MPALRRVLDIAALVLIGGILCETWIVGGLLSAYTISGASMAPALLGPHREITCPQCGCSWAADWNGLDDQAFFTCPDCGTAARRDASRLSLETSGDRILLDRTVLASKSGFRRWDLVAFRHPERTRELVVKRIVGLPGERIEIRDGDVYVNGKIARKSLRQFLAMAVPVFGWNHVSEESSPSTWGWFPINEVSDWAVQSACLVHEPVEELANSETIDWITFGSGDSKKPARIVDLLGYNAGRSRRDETVNDVADFGVSFLLEEPSGDGDLRVQLQSRARRYELRLNWPSRRLWLLHDGRDVDHGSIPPSLGRPFRITFATFDGKAVVSVNDRQTLEYLDNAASQAQADGAFPLQIGATSIECRLCQINIVRDIYYTCPNLSPPHWGCETPIILGKNAYYCLGDNSFVSEDSRTWKNGPEMPASLIVGRPFVVFRYQAPKEGQGYFRVPKWPTIHYIH